MDWFSAKNSAGDFDTCISSFLDDDDPPAFALRGGIDNYYTNNSDIFCVIATCNNLLESANR